MNPQLGENITLTIDPKENENQRKQELIDMWIPEDKITPLILRRYERLQKDIGARLDLRELTSATTVSERLRVLEALYKKHEAELTPLADMPVASLDDAYNLWESFVSSSPEALQKVATDAIADTKSNMLDAATSWVWNSITTFIDNYIKKFTASIPGIWWFTESLSVRGYVSSIIASITWIFSGFRLIGAAKADTLPQNEETDWSEKPDITPPPVEAPEPDVVTPIPEITAPITETDVSQRYTSWAKFIVALNINLWSLWKLSPDNVYKELQNLTYTEIMSLDPQVIPEGFLWIEASEEEKELFQKIVESLQSDDTQDFLRIWLNNNSLKNIIRPFWKINTALLPYFWDTLAESERELNSILSQSEKWIFNWKDLSFEQISVLYIGSIPALRVPAIWGLKDLSSSVHALIFWDTGIVNEVSQSWISQDVVSWFATLGADLTYGIASLQKDDTEIQEQVLSGIPEWSREESSETVSEIIEFKNQLLLDFSTQKKLGLDLDNQALFKKNLSYGYVLALYSILWGKADLELISPLALPPLLFVTWKILAWWDIENSLESWEFIWRYLYNVLDSEKSPLTEDEEKVLEIYGKKAFDSIFLSHFRAIWNALWVQEWFTWIDTSQLALWSFAWWAVLNLGGKALTARALKRDKISLSWVAARRFGGYAMIASIIIWGTNWYAKSWSWNQRSERVQWALDSSDTRELVRLLQEERNAIKNIETKDGKKVTVFAYEWEAPRFVIDGRVYEVNTWPLNLIEQINSWINWTKVIGNFAKDFISTDTWINKWVDMKLQRYEWGNIVFWQGEDTVKIPLNSVINRISDGTPDLIGEDFFQQLSGWEDRLNLFGIDLWSDGEKWFLLNIDEGGTAIFLADIWSTKDLLQINW